MPLQLSSRSLVASEPSINEGFTSLHCRTGSSLRTGAWAPKVAGRGPKRLKQKLIWLDLFHFLVYSPYFFFFLLQNSESCFPLIQTNVSLIAGWSMQFSLFLFVLGISIFLILFLRISIPFSPSLSLAFLPGRTALPSVIGVLVSLSICYPPDSILTHPNQHTYRIIIWH